VAIVPLLPDGKVILVRQYRYAAGKTLLEIPAGTLEPQESPLLCAHRELREETGYEAEEITPLLICFMAPGYSSEVIHFYVARRLKHMGDVQDADEDISLEICELEDVKKMIEENEIEDAKTIIGIKILDS
jgi:ADP-ribose pyrophosphatase